MTLPTPISNIIRPRRRLRNGEIMATNFAKLDISFTRGGTQAHLVASPDFIWTPVGLRDLAYALEEIALVMDALEKEKEKGESEPDEWDEPEDYRACGCED